MRLRGNPWTTILLAALATGACEGRFGAVRAAGADGDADSDADADGDGDGDTDADADGDADGDVVCGDFTCSNGESCASCAPDCGSCGMGPVVFFSDLVSGPDRGGENDLGAFVTLYGRGFGAAQGDSTVTVGGQRVRDVRSWSEARIVVQLGGDAETGPIVVTTGTGASNGIAFEVRSGDIYFVDEDGGDGDDGSFDSPFGSLPRALEALAPGDIVYARDGVSQTSDDGRGWRSALSVSRSGEPGSPIAIVAYPGATVTIGGVRSPDFALRGGDFSGHIVVAGLRLVGHESAIALNGTDIRIVGNDASCPNTEAPVGCIELSRASEVKVLGNGVHHTNTEVPSRKMFHTIYFTTDTNHVEAAWNNLHDLRSCNAIQVHSSPLGDDSGYNQYDISIHDNFIDGDACSGINFATVDPSRGRVEAYDNVIVHSGNEPPDDDYSAMSCIQVAGYTNNGSRGSGVVEVFNNTCYDTGNTDPTYDGPSGAFYLGENAPDGLRLRLRNNLVQQTGQSYFAPWGQPSEDRIEGSNNLFSGGAGGWPDALAGSIDDDPGFVDLAGLNLRLDDGSPAIDAGAATGIARDFDGVPRPEGDAYDIGAFEHPE